MKCGNGKEKKNNDAHALFEGVREMEGSGGTSAEKETSGNSITPSLTQSATDACSCLLVCIC